MVSPKKRKLKRKGSLKKIKKNSPLGRSKKQSTNDLLLSKSPLNLTLKPLHPEEEFKSNDQDVQDEPIRSNKSKERIQPS
mmetsp:Transcript_11914/g.11818  ORF Transcript_11914/g.11818 Transcript_11914/m.11818 type:complete len:80 (-) Transcript_11914:195-434(-)